MSFKGYNYYRETLSLSVLCVCLPARCCTVTVAF